MEDARQPFCADYNVSMLFVPIWRFNADLPHCFQELKDLSERIESNPHLYVTENTADRIVYERSGLVELRGVARIRRGATTSRISVLISCPTRTLSGVVFLPFFLAMWCWGSLAVANSDGPTSGIQDPRGQAAFFLIGAAVVVTWFVGLCSGIIRGGVTILAPVREMLSGSPMGSRPPSAPGKRSRLRSGARHTQRRGRPRVHIHHENHSTLVSVSRAIIFRRANTILLLGVIMTPFAMIPLGAARDLWSRGEYGNAWIGIVLTPIAVGLAGLLLCLGIRMAIQTLKVTIADQHIRLEWWSGFVRRTRDYEPSRLVDASIAETGEWVVGADIHALELTIAGENRPIRVLRGHPPADLRCTEHNLRLATGLPLDADARKPN